MSTESTVWEAINTLQSIAGLTVAMARDLLIKRHPRTLRRHLENLAAHLKAIQENLEAEGLLDLPSD